ncbi:MAG: efflux RND transporter periplasmic adaptor subunit, partial [Proteobacteria bacterium]|nr:efflux RND transporter periplasmic adaptor subunit [Pseudomonadota bacterium]
CGRGHPAAPPAERAPAAGRLTVTARQVPDLKPTPGTLTTRDMAEARARIGGVLVSLDVKAGDTVRAGQVIARVRDERLGLETHAYDAQVTAAAAEAARAEAELARTKDLFSHGVYAKARLEQVEAQAKAANASLSAAKAQRGASAELGAQGAIVAPAAGKVLTADVPIGSVVMPGQTVVKLTAGPLVVRLELPEADAANLKVGQAVQLDAADLGGTVTSGAITQVYPAVSGGQATADVTAANLPRDLIGRRVRASVTLGQRTAVIVPRRYISSRFGIDYVRLVLKDGTVSEAPIQTAAGPTPDTVEALSGLHDGDVLTPPAAPR